MLTGKDVYHIAMQGLQQDDVHIHNEAFYAFIAQKLNNSHIAPLQGLVKEYREMLNRWDPITPDFALTNHPYDKQRLELDERTQQLCGEESTS